jgi:hypothetical protein
MKITLVSYPVLLVLLSIVHKYYFRPCITPIITLVVYRVMIYYLRSHLQMLSKLLPIVQGGSSLMIICLI